MKLKTHDDRLTLTNGSYHALVHARKPKGIENKSAYLIGTGIGALAAGCFLIRDAHMDGSKITFFEQLDLPGGSLDGEVLQNLGYVARGDVKWDITLKFYGIYLVHFHLLKIQI
ncbi:myosin-cross-reactive antigen [Clostridium perfringens NCTC 8239]|nr:myosin-cross-reactive antigen [Clostridium perfringens NCTC 8239]